MQRTNVFKTLLANLSNIGGTPSAGNSVATTPRGSTGGAGSQPLQPVGGSSRGRRGPAPEEAAAIGQAVYQLVRWGVWGCWCAWCSGKWEVTAEGGEEAG